MSMRTRMFGAAGLALMTAIAVAVWSFGGAQAQEVEQTEPAVVETGTTMLTVRGVATRALTPDQTTIEFEVTGARRDRPERGPGWRSGAARDPVAATRLPRQRRRAAHAASLAARGV